MAGPDTLVHQLTQASHFISNILSTVMLPLNVSLDLGLVYGVQATTT